MSLAMNALAQPKAKSRQRLAVTFAAAFAVLTTALPHGAFARAAPESFADLADQVMDAVVNISAATTVEARNRTLPQLPQGSPFDDLFEEFFNRRGQQPPGGGEAPQQRQRRSNSLGSGFVVDASGIVITNNHLIGDENEITV